MELGVRRSLYLKVDNLVNDVLILLLKEEEKFVSLNAL